MFTIESILGIRPTGSDRPPDRSLACVTDDRRSENVRRMSSSEPEEVFVHSTVSPPPPRRVGEKRKSLSDTEEDTDRDSLAGYVSGTLD